MLVPVILCGGAGSRLWPLSREQHPKPFIKLHDGESLLQKAYLRARGLGVEHLLTITNRELFFKVEDEYGIYPKNDIHHTYILEPIGRNTAAAVAMAALHVKKTLGDEATLLILAADHLIQHETAFQEAVIKAQSFASNGQMVTFGMTPTYPETGFGYIEAEGNNVLRFKEKPSLDVAESYLARGNFYWNSGMFCLPVGAFLAAFQRHAASIYASCHDCLAISRVASGHLFTQIELDSSFGQVKDDSIDYAFFEPLSMTPNSQQISVVPCDLGWSDVGSWKELSQLKAADECNNRIEGDVYVEDTRNTFVQSSNRVVGVVGVDDLIIVDTSDALLVAHRDHTQSVKGIYNYLKAKAHDAYKIHRTAFRPWGAYTVLEEGEGFKIKRIEVKPGASLSLQMHHHRSEHWIVVSGMAKVLNGEQEFLIHTNESTYIPAGHKHRLHNPGKIPLIMIEVQSGAYLGEDDIIRFEDVYGRV
ncbi:MAG: mannose-1-phosphate guanylyltransferase/mannose-6-phosphate isomerase [Gammaproteobacteria bacterium]|nr:mannose-1-phosphate guanylyltransferase/mannose-6-phosphate isomerase [Gammaproteobacteria bacterium]